MSIENLPTPELSNTQTESFRTLAEFRFTHALYRKNLKERIDAQLVIAHNGGLFKATPELMSFLTLWDTPEIYIEDSFNNPIRCDRLQLLTQAKEAYQFAMNAWHIEFEESKKIRKTLNV